jgi:hypothetical protein
MPGPGAWESTSTGGARSQHAPRDGTVTPAPNIAASVSGTGAARAVEVTAETAAPQPVPVQRPMVPRLPTVSHPQPALPFRPRIVRDPRRLTRDASRPDRATPEVMPASSGRTNVPGARPSGADAVGAPRASAGTARPAASAEPTLAIGEIEVTVINPPARPSARPAPARSARAESGGLALASRGLAWVVFGR